jgi:integrase
MQKNTANTRKPESFKRLKNSELREREHLLPDEVERLIQAAKSVGRHGLRDSLLIMTGYHHGLRVSEICDLRWSDLDFKSAHLFVRRLKGSNPSTHPIDGRELRGLRALLRSQGKEPSPWVFVSERKAPLTPDAVRKMVARAGEVAQLPFPIHPHMLRHSCGYYLAAKGYDLRLIQSWLGHRSLANTLLYTQLAPGQLDTVRWD